MNGSPRPDAGRLALAGLLSLACAMGVGRFVYTPILPHMAEGLGLNAGRTGLIASANFAGYLIGALLAAAPVFARAPRRWMLAGLYLSALTTLAMAGASGMTLFLLLRFVGGAASAFVLVFASTVILDRLSAQERGGLSSLHFAGVGVGIAASAAVVWLMSAAGADWRALWLGSGAVALAAAMAAHRMTPAAPLTGNGRSDAAEPSAAGLGALPWAYGLFGFGYVITATFLVAIVRASPQARAVEPLVWLAVGLAAAPSVALWRWAGDRIGPRRAFAVAGLIEAGGVALSVAWPAVAGALAAAVLLGGTFMGMTALGLQAARQSAADPRRAMALMTAAFGLGQIVGPFAAGASAQLWGSFTPVTLAASASLIVASALAQMRRGHA